MCIANFNYILIFTIIISRKVSNLFLINSFSIWNYIRVVDIFIIIVLFYNINYDYFPKHERPLVYEFVCMVIGCWRLIAFSSFHRYKYSVLVGTRYSVGNRFCNISRLQILILNEASKNIYKIFMSIYSILIFIFPFEGSR